MNSPCSVRLVFALHNHQPVGNFDGVFEAAYRDSYSPFLEVMEDYPEFPFVLHTSGPLMEWLADRKPEYVDRLKGMVAAGRVEVLGGPFFEPILTNVPRRDRVGQIKAYREYLRDLLGADVRGAWVPERVWEQSLVGPLVEAGVEYTILDDFHFQRAGLAPGDLHGYYLTEDEGRLLKVFPSSERLRYLVPFREPHESYEWLHRLATERPGAVAVCADDGEKFGSWPDTFDHVFTRGWLRRFCDMVRGNSEWLRPSTLADAVAETLPVGKVYLPDGSYREMTEWALPAAANLELKAARSAAKGHPQAERLLPFAAAGGFWRNFKAKYPESDAMYARMLGVSRRLEAAEANEDADPDYLAAARDELYRGQCNCPYWHGSFGGLYLPHLRNAIYRHLIAADNALDDAEGKEGPRVSALVDDFNLDARQEARIENDKMVAFVRPSTGGHLYELDVRRTLTNLLDTLDRRPEPYHEVIAEAGGRSQEAPEFSEERLTFKQEGLDALLVYDRSPRKAFVDHVYPLDATLEDLIACRDIERGDFVTGAYFAKVSRGPGRVALEMNREGVGDGHAFRARKLVSLAAGSESLEVTYVLEDLPEGSPVHFAVELNVGAMAGHADDRYYSGRDDRRLGTLDAKLDLASTDGISLTDEWLDLAVGLEWSRPAGLWCHPIETVSQSEGGFEGVYQSSAVVPHWVITADASRRWELTIRWTLGRARPEAVASALASGASSSV